MTSIFRPTHEFHLHDGTIIAVAAELRGDWIAFEADGTCWYTVCGDLARHWACRVRNVDDIKRVIKFGHRFYTETKGQSHRFVCECGQRGSWVRSDDRAADRGDAHDRDACRVQP